MKNKFFADVFDKCCIVSVIDKFMSSEIFAFLSLYLAVLIIPLVFIRFDYHSVSFVISLFLCSVSSFSLLKRFDKLPLLRLFFLIFPCFFYVLQLIPVSINSRGLTKDDIMAVFQTNVPEACDYLTNNLHILRIVYFLVLLCVLFAFIYLSVKQNARKKNLISNSATALACLITGLFLMYFNRDNSLVQPIREAVYQIKVYRRFYANLKNNRKPDSVRKNTPKGIYVVVIGESQNKNHMSVYGYARHPTTPYLSEMKKNKNWLFFDNAHSCHTHTILVLTYALTQKNIYNAINLQDAYSIMEILHEFDTYWISNQKAIGNFGEPITEIGLQAKTPVFINKSFIEENPYDASLLKELPEERQLQNTAVIFIHLMGNHSKYNLRYPDDFKKWDDNYDNSILYNDYIVRQIYNHFSSMKNFMAFIYFSDHSEDPKCGCHDASRFTWEMTKIPFYAYFSDDYIDKYSQKYKTLKDHLHTPFTNDMMFDTLLGILDITDKRFYVPEDDLSDIRYNHTMANLSTLHGERLLSDETAENLQSYSLEKTLELYKKKSNK